MFEVYAYTIATDDGPEIEVKIADVHLHTPLHTSRWADEHLYFRHEQIARDRKYWKRSLRGHDEDPRFNIRDPDQLWGNDVP